MQFGHTYDLVMSGVKTQTRRVQKHEGSKRVGAQYKIEQYLPPIDRLWAWEELRPFPGEGVYIIEGVNGGWLNGEYCVEPEWKITAKWLVGHTYAAQPGRGRKAGGRILLTGIRSERVQDITNEDALAEGMGWVGESSPRDNYAELWDIVHPRKGERWDDNPLTWVLVFRLVKEA